METESNQVARFFKNPEWTDHYQVFQDDVKRGLNSQANLLLFALCIKYTGERGKSTPEEFFDHCLEKTLTWVSDFDSQKKITPAEILKKSNAIREGILRQEEAIRSEENFRSWLQRALACNATVQEPTISTKGDITDPFTEASEKIAILGATKLLAKEKEEEIAFPLSDTKIEVRPKLPIGIDIFDQTEFFGGPEFDAVLGICGETNVGKTHLGLFTMSTMALQRKNVLVISGEDSAQENKKRLLSHFMRTTSERILGMTEKERNAIMHNLYGDPEDPLSLQHHIRTKFGSICPSEGQLTPNYIKEQVQKMEDKMEEPVHAIMVDYLQKAKPDGKTAKMQRDEELEVFVNQLAENGENHYLTILISQIPSHAAGGKTEFLGLKQATARSYAATWGCHYLITMNRTEEEMARLGRSEDKRPRLNLFLCKNKNGPIGTCFSLGYPHESRWRFFRKKEELLRCVDSQKA